MKTRTYRTTSQAIAGCEGMVMVGAVPLQILWKHLHLCQIQEVFHRPSVVVPCSKMAKASSQRFNSCRAAACREYPWSKPKTTCAFLHAYESLLEVLQVKVTG